MTLPLPDHPDYANADRTVDARGTLCPEPLRRCRAAIETVAPGEMVHVLATDPHSGIDLDVFARRGGHEVVRADEAEGVFHYLLRRGG